MKQVFVVPPTVLLFATFLMTVTAYQERLCFKGTEAEPAGNVTLDCPDGQVISIDEALFGRNKWGACVISDKDCVERTRIFSECENVNTCTKSFKTYSTACGYATVMFISYTCLQVEPLTTFTTTSDTKSTAKKNQYLPGPQIHVVTKSSEVPSANSDNRMKEIGLIAGCVVAAVATVIALVIAISMVVRRLLQKSTADDDDNSLESKNNIPCICTGCSFCFTSDKSSHQDRLHNSEKICSSSTVPRHDRKKNCTEIKTVPADKENTLICGTVETGGQRLEETGFENISLSAQGFTAYHTTLNNQQERENAKNINSNSKIKSINAIEDTYCNLGMDSSPKIVEEHLNEDSENNKHNYNFPELKSKIISKKSVSESEKTSKKLLVDKQGDSPSDYHSQPKAGNENVYNQPTTKNVPKYDAISIPNTHRGTAC